MKKIVRLTESELHKLIENSVRRLMEGEGGVCAAAQAGLGGAPNAGISANSAYIAPAGDVQRRDPYKVKDKVSDGMTEVDPTPALRRKDGEGGSISINRKK